MKSQIELVVRKGDVIEFGSKPYEGTIVKYPSNAQITVEKENGKCVIICKEDIVGILVPFIPKPVEPKVRSEKEQQRINEILTKVKLYLLKLEEECLRVTKEHQEIVTTHSHIRRSPKYVSELNDRKIGLERLNTKILRYVDPVVGKFDSDLIRTICTMVETNKIEFVTDYLL